MNQGSRLQCKGGTVREALTKAGALPSVNLPPVSVGPTCLTVTMESDIEPSNKRRAEVSVMMK